MLKTIAWLFVLIFLVSLGIEYAHAEDLPLNHVWRGVQLCSYGPRAITVVDAETPEGPLYTIVIAPQDPHDNRFGLMLARAVPDDQYIRLVVDHVLLPIDDMPPGLIGHIDPASGKFYGGMSGGPKVCDYFETEDATDDYAEKILSYAESNPEGFVHDERAALSAGRYGNPSAADLLALGLFVGGLAW